MSKYSVPDGHWDEEDDENEDADTKPAVEVTRHTIRILHYRNHRDSDLQDHEWLFSIERGEIVGVMQSHRLAGSNQFDPMGGGWRDVPGAVKRMLANELQVEDLKEHVDFDSPGVIYDG
jgi:hypothetical protein